MATVQKWTPATLHLCLVPERPLTFANKAFISIGLGETRKSHQRERSLPEAFWQGSLLLSQML
jgi:hypothetical protein